MAIRNILVAYHGDPKTCSGLGFGLFMAKKYDAHITGVVGRGPGPVDPQYNAYLPKALLETIERRAAEMAAEDRTHFEERATAEGLADRATFLDLDITVESALSERAREFDVVVLGRQPLGSERPNFAIRPDVVALRSGRPVIIVPRAYDVSRLGDHALLAWDGRRAAARALGDAMHILETKQKVTVLTVGEDGVTPPTDGVLKLLDLHGIPAEGVVKMPGRGGIGQTILDSCRDAGAGLLVMGAYEHSKFSEDLLGGVTRYILDNADLPVLMAH